MTKVIVLLDKLSRPAARPVGEVRLSAVAACGNPVADVSTDSHCGPKVAAAGDFCAGKIVIE